MDLVQCRTEPNSNTCVLRPAVTAGVQFGLWSVTCLTAVGLSHQTSVQSEKQVHPEYRIKDKSFDRKVRIKRTISSKLEITQSNTTL